MRRATSIWVNDATAFASSGLVQVDLGEGRVARLRHLLLPLERAGPLLFESREACVFQFCKFQRGLRRLQPGPGLVDAFLHFIAG